MFIGNSKSLKSRRETWKSGCGKCYRDCCIFGSASTSAVPVPVSVDFRLGDFEVGKLGPDIAGVGVAEQSISCC